MLLVIVGAGASFDSVPARPPRTSNFEPYRPPLADELFQSRPQFEAIQRQIPQVMQIAPSLLIRANAASVEDVLARYAAEAAEYPPAATQLAAVRFYLQGVIGQCETGWYRDDRQTPTNLMGLVNQIERARRGREQAIFVTFNYDRLIENALENRGQPFASLEHYVSPVGIRLYKLHGSVDWARRIARMDTLRFGSSAWPIAKQICDEILTFPSGGSIQKVASIPSSIQDGYLMLPAIAIPLKEKSDFECPNEHIASLKAALKDVTTVLTIGWRGAERHFLKLLAQSGMKPVQGICVAGGPDEAEETVHNILSCVPGNFEPYNAGFTNFVAQGKIERLLNITWT